jgi:hypothetical protein
MCAPQSVHVTGKRHQEQQYVQRPCNTLAEYACHLGMLGERAAVMYSLIGLARLNGFDPEAPLRPQRGV